MKFDNTLGKEATFQDWVDDGCKKAEAILEKLDQNKTDIPESENQQLN